MFKIINKKNLLIITLIFIEIIFIFLTCKSINNKVIKLDNNTDKSNLFAIILEQDNGEYKESDINDWPSDGYIYNDELSYCNDAYGNKLVGVLNYDSDAKKVSVDFDSAGYCYLYFDKVIEI